MIFSPQLVYLFAAGFAEDPEKFDLTVDLTRIMFPYLIFVSLVAWAMGVLNAEKRFAAPAAAPIVVLPIAHPLDRHLHNIRLGAHLRAITKPRLIERRSTNAAERRQRRQVHHIGDVGLRIGRVIYKGRATDIEERFQVRSRIRVI